MKTFALTILLILTATLSAADLPAVERFWSDRASETRRINGELWSIRIQLEGERLASINHPNALAYLQPGAPNYVRLKDGQQARNVAEIVSGSEGVEIVEGRVMAVDGDVVTVRVSQRPDRFKKVSGLNAGQLALFTAMIKPVKEPQVPVFIVTRMVEGKRVAVDVPVMEVTPEELRRECREMKVVGFADYRAVKVGGEPDFKSTIGNETLARMRYISSTYTRTDYKWSTHTILIPVAAR